MLEGFPIINDTFVSLILFVQYMLLQTINTNQE